MTCSVAWLRLPCRAKRSEHSMRCAAKRLQHRHGAGLGRMLCCGRSETMRKWLSRNHLGLPYRRRRHPLLSNPSWPAETVLAGLRRRPDREPPACGSVRFSDRTSSERDRTRPDFLDLEGSEVARRAIPQLTYAVSAHHRLTFLLRQCSHGTSFRDSASTTPTAKRVTALPGRGASRLRTARRPNQLRPNRHACSIMGTAEETPSDRLYVQAPYVQVSNPASCAAVSMKRSRLGRLP